MEMKRFKIGDLYTVSNGLSKGKAFFGQGYPFLTFSEVMNNFFVPNTLLSLVQTEINERAKFSIHRGDIFLNRTSETADELGISCVALKDYPNATFNGFCKRLRPVGEDVVPEYIGYYMRTNAFRKHMLVLTGSMITRASLRNEQLLSIEIELPSKENQLKIAHFLRQYDLLIDNCKKQIALLEEAAQRLYREWFVDMRFPGHESTPIGENGLPGGWEHEKVGSLLRKIKRSVLVQTADYKEAGSLPIIDQSRKFIAGYTDNLDTKVSENLPVILFGDHTRILKFITFDFARGADGTQLIISNNLERMPQCLFFLSLKNVDLSNYSYARHFKYLKEEKVLMPTVVLAQKFEAVISLYFNEISVLQKIQNKCSSVRDILLPRLISGQIEIKA